VLQRQAPVARREFRSRLLDARRISEQDVAVAAHARASLFTLLLPAASAARPATVGQDTVPCRIRPPLIHRGVSMASYTIDVSSKSKYRANLNTLWLAVTDAGWPRRTKTDDHAFHDVVVTDGGNSVTLIQRQRNLYITGIRHPAGPIFFKDEVDPGARGSITTLSIGSSYTESTSDGLGILKEDKFSKSFKWGQQEISQAIIDIGGFGPRSTLSDPFRKGMGIFAFLIAEAMRFNEMFSVMQRLLSNSTEKITFGRYAEVVTNWQKTSNTTGKEDSAKHDTLKRLKTRLV
jgi:hypothetical protein